MKNITINIQRLCVFEKKDPSHKILKDIELSIDFSQGNICIMGESGSGKSTLLNALSQNLAPSLALNPNSIDTNLPNPCYFTLFQDADLYLSPHYPLGKYIRLAFRGKSWDPGRVGSLVEKLNISVTLPGKQEKENAIHPNQPAYWDKLTREDLSGGNKQKFMILLGLLFNPDILLLDETFTDIDDLSRDSIVENIFDSQAGKIMVSHDYILVKRLVEQGRIRCVYSMSEGRLLPGYWDLHSQPQWVQDMEKNHQAINRIIENKQNPAKETVSNLLTSGSTSRYRIHKLLFAYDRIPVIDFDSSSTIEGLTLYRTCNYALTGDNGIGKSTLFKILMKLEPYKSGNKAGILFIDGDRTHGEELSSLSRYRYVLLHQLVFQKTGNSLQTQMSIRDFLLSYFKDPSQKKEKITELEDLCASFKIPNSLLNGAFLHLSVGQQRRIMLIRALLLLGHNGCLFIDEAMRGMDIDLKRSLIQYLLGRPYQVFLISHDAQLRSALCHKEINMSRIEGKTHLEIHDL